MRRLKLLAGVIAAICLLAIPRVHAQNTSNFTIESFEADYYVSRDAAKTSQLSVTEQVTAVFPDFDQNHGILRAIPKTYQGHTLSLEVKTVTDMSGHPYRYTTYTDHDNLVLKIGEPDKYVHGRVGYTIKYTMRNVATYYTDHDEWYWDVNGDQWQQPFDSVTARLHIDQAIAPALQNTYKCFSGVYGSTGQTCNITGTDDNGGVIVTATARHLQPGETLTFVLGFGKGTFAQGPEVARERLRQLIVMGLIIAAIVLPPFITAVYVYRKWKRYGKDPKGRGVIIPEYLPPKGLNVLSSSMLLHERVVPANISAAIVELAVKRYITIYEEEQDKLIGKKKLYSLELARDADDLSAEQQHLVQAIFGNLAAGAQISLETLKNKLYGEVSELDKMIGDDLAVRQYFRSSPRKARKSYTTGGWVLLALGFVLFILPPIGIGLLISGAIFLLTARAMPARTQAGVEMHDYLEGLKMYMKLAEADRIKYLQSPEGAEKLPTGTDINSQKFKVKLFEDLLPYAVLFGIEKEWAKQFKDLYQQPPDWYRGNWSTFNTAYLASSLGSFNGAAMTAFTSPSSSSSSGFGGGGFSGGGGGGGGGGGW
jgi:uncharacterized membrane protein YgcG